MKRTIFYVKLKIPSFSGGKKISENLAPWGASPPDRNWLSLYVGVAVSTSWFLLKVEVKVKLLLPGHRAYAVALLILEKETSLLPPSRAGWGWGGDNTKQGQGAQPGFQVCSLTS